MFTRLCIKVSFHIMSSLVYMAPHAWRGNVGLLSVCPDVSSALELRGKKVGQLNVWEAVQKENLLTAQNKSERESDSARLKRTSMK